MPEQASLFVSGIPLEIPLEVHSLWTFASVTPGRTCLMLPILIMFYFILAHLSFSQAARPTQLGCTGLQDLKLTQGAVDQAVLLLGSCLLLLHALCACTKRLSAAHPLRPDSGMQRRTL